MKGKFSSLDSPIKNTMTKIGPRHFTCDKIEPIISWQLGEFTAKILENNVRENIG